MSIETISGFTVRVDLAYDMKTHMWVDASDPERVRIGMDALGLETSGTLAQLQYAEVGATVSCGSEMGSLEAEKFVGPLVCPLSGTVVAVNESSLESPSIVERDPFGDGWMIELTPSALEDELAMLVTGRDAIVDEFSRKVKEYRRDGVLAE